MISFRKPKIWDFKKIDFKILVDNFVKLENTVFKIKDWFLSILISFRKPKIWDFKKIDFKILFDNFAKLENVDFKIKDWF